VLEFSLEARRGHFHLQCDGRFSSRWTVVFGPSGAGKSTLLRLLAGLDRPDRGHVTFEGEALTDTKRHVHCRLGRRATSLVAQQPALFPHMSVAANIAYGIAALKPAQRAARVDEMLALVEASPLAQRRPGELSGGEAQRVALARALAPLPRLLLLDEPFSALDGEASDAIVSRLQVWLSAHQVQTVLVTHDATDAFASEAEVAILHEGRIATIGPAPTALAAERQRILDRLSGA
jgi:ABC-type sulfate/molybdate transport systems ATPase subunit